MCEFASWIEFKGETYFIDDDKLNTKEGRELIQYCKNKEDLRGHGAIRHYYPELKEQGTERECTDFSTPSNFPKEIVNAIKKGKFREIGIVLDILNAEGKRKYDKIKQSAWAEYNKIIQSAWAEYEKIIQSAFAEYYKIIQPASAEYDKIKQSAWAEYIKIKQSAFWDIAKQSKYRIKAWK